MYYNPGIKSVTLIANNKVVLFFLLAAPCGQLNNPQAYLHTLFAN